MGQASRTTKLLLDLSDRAGGGANTGKRAYLEETAKILDAARAFYVAFFLAHPDKLIEHIEYFSEKHQAVRERLISPNELLTWAETLTIATREHPRPLPSYNFSSQFPDFPFIYRRAAHQRRYRQSALLPIESEQLERVDVQLTDLVYIPS
jgi:hypothetical protein